MRHVMTGLLCAAVLAIVVGCQTSTAPKYPEHNNQKSDFWDARSTFKSQLVYQGPSPQEYEEAPTPKGAERVSYTSEGLELWGYFGLPGGWNARVFEDEEGRVPAVVYVHGGFAFGPSDWHLAQPFRSAGFALFCPTFRGENGNPGNFELLLGEVDDALNAARWLASHPKVDPKRVYIFGHSSGGAIAAMTAYAPNGPVQITGSSGSMYPDDLFQAWTFAPFDPTREDERRFRLFLPNIEHLMRPHFAFLGIDEAQQAIARPELDFHLERVPGEHFAALYTAITRFTQIISAHASGTP